MVASWHTKATYSIASSLVHSLGSVISGCCEPSQRQAMSIVPLMAFLACSEIGVCRQKARSQATHCGCTCLHLVILKELPGWPLFCKPQSLFGKDS